MIKWHDVTKNPSDLPKPNANGDCKDVAVVNEIEGVKYGFIARYDDKRGKWFQYKTDYEVTSEIGDEESEDRIICWAYLDGDGEEAPEPSPKEKVMELRKRLMDDIFNINMRVCESLKFIKGYESDFPLGETTLAVKGTLAQVESKIESAFADYERGERCD